MEDSHVDIRSYIPFIIVTLVLFFSVIWAYQSAKNRTSMIVLPAGNTYLGPSPSPSSPSTQNSVTSSTWSTWKGAMFPYTFSYPSAMSLGLFPDDPTDSVTAFIDGTDASSNIFFRVEKLTGSVKDYAENWWKQYNWKGLKTISEFTNSNGLKGYRATYMSDKGDTPYDHVFLEVPEKKDLVIWISGRLFSKGDFDRLVTSVSWKN